MLRAKAAITQQELAEKLGVTQAMIGQYERGIRQPKIETLIRIANSLEVDFVKLIGSDIPITRGELPNGADSAHGTIAKQIDLTKFPSLTAEEKNELFHRVFDECLNDVGKLRVVEYAMDLMAQKKYLLPNVELLKDGEQE